MSHAIPHVPTDNVHFDPVDGRAPLILGTNAVNRMQFNGNDFTVTFGGNAQVVAGATFMNASSRSLKQDIRSLTAAEAYEALHGLEPVRFAYIADPAQQHVGFIAEDVPDLVAAPDRKGVSAMEIVGVLTKVVQEQDATIGELRSAVAALTARLDAIEGGR